MQKDMFNMNDENLFKTALLKVATEGRKYNVEVRIMCEKISDVPPKLLSQCRHILPITSGRHKGKHIVSTGLFLCTNPF